MCPLYMTQTNLLQTVQLVFNGFLFAAFVSFVFLPFAPTDEEADEEGDEVDEERDSKSDADGPSHAPPERLRRDFLHFLCEK